jgi:hypothetical protein
MGMAQEDAAQGIAHHLRVFGVFSFYTDRGDIRAMPCEGRIIPATIAMFIYP